MWEKGESKTFTDQLGREIRLDAPPKRIVSLVPSQTELLFDLGLDERVAGITRYCIHPKEKCRNRTRIGGTKKLNFEKIQALQPDLILGNKEENERSQIEAWQKQYPVWMSDIHDLPDALEMIRSVGALVQADAEAEKLSKSIAQDFETLETTSSDQPTERVAYFIWKAPFMVAGSPTFIDDLLQRCRWENVYAGQPSRYPETDAEALRKLAPDRILLSSEPFPFREKHIAEFQSICPEARVEIVDGELFSWYGSRLTRSAAYFRSLR